VKIKRMLSSAAAVALVLGGLVLTADALVASAATTTVPAITLTPDIGLLNGQVIRLSGSGFTAGASLVAVECNGQSKGVAGCDTSKVEPITVMSDGTFTTSFAVIAGTVGNGTCGIGASDALCFVAIGTTSDALLADASIAFAGGPGVSLSPSTGLTNTQSVTLTGADFTAGDSVYAIECLATATTRAGCDTSTVVPMTVSPQGTLPSTYFKVVTGKIGTGSCGTSAADYAACIIEVANAGGTDRGIATMDFVAPAVTVSSSPVATRVSGPAVIGRSVAVIVYGKNFTTVSKVTGGAGSSVRVTGVSRTALHVTITESVHAKPGTSTLVIKFKNGKSARVHYAVKRQI
jgi:Neocarzinostatin family